MYPILVDLYGFEIRSFEVMLLVAWAMGLSLAVQQEKTEGLDGSRMSVCWFWGLIGAVVSARLPDLLSSPPATYDGPVLMQFLERLQHSRSSSLSGLLGAAVTGTGILFFHRQAILRYADAAVPGIFILLAMCRLGCFLNGCCFGVPTGGGGAVGFIQILQQVSMRRHSATFGLFQRNCCLHRATSQFQFLLYFSGHQCRRREQSAAS